MYKVTWFDGVTRNFKSVADIDGCVGFRNTDDSAGIHNTIKSVEFFQSPEDKLPAGVVVNKTGFIHTLRRLSIDNQKITAIKVVRDVTGWGLKESKDFVDGL